MRSKFLLHFFHAMRVLPIFGLLLNFSVLCAQDLPGPTTPVDIDWKLPIGKVVTGETISDVSRNYTSKEHNSREQSRTVTEEKITIQSLPSEKIGIQFVRTIKEHERTGAKADKVE